MSRTIQTQLSRLFLLGVLLSFALGLNYLNAWTAPTQAPTGGNVAAPLNTGGTTQTKGGGLLMSSLDIIGTNGVSLVGGQLSFWNNSTIVNPSYTIDMGDLDPGANNGIRFPDDTVMTTAPTGGIGSVQIVGYVCSGGTNCAPSSSCSSFGQYPTCNTLVCPVGTTLASYDEIDRWTDSGCTSTGSGGQCQGPWSRTYYRMVGLCT